MADPYAKTFDNQDINQERDEFGRPIDVVQEGIDSLEATPAVPLEPTVSPLDAFKNSPPVEMPKEEMSPLDAFKRSAPVGVSREPISPLDAFKNSPLPNEAQEFQPAPFDKYEEGGLTKELALADSDVIDLMRDGLELRYGSRGAVRSAAVYALGGASGGYTSSMEDEDVFEMWQNWQRSFAGGQTVTVANELAFTTTLDDTQKALMGSQYLMFDKNPNIFSAKTGWGEMFDGMRDYATAAIWDPLTVASLGVGKALGAGGTKAASVLIRENAKVAFRESLKQGVGRTAARASAQATVRRQFAGTVTADIAKYSALDFAANIASDALYQKQLMDTGAQEEYSALQTSVAGLATIMLPAIVGSSKAFSAFSNSASAPAGLKASVDVSETFKGLTNEVIDERLQARIDWTKFDNEFSETAGDLATNRGEYTKWSDAKVEALELLGDDMSLNPVEGNFMRSFLYGPADNSKKGFVQAMSDAGLVYVPRGEDDKITNFIGDVISWVPPETIDKFVKGFTDEFGDITGLVKKEGATSSEQLSSFWKLRQSNAGDRLRDSSYARYLLENNLEGNSTAADMINALSRGDDAEKPAEIGKYVLSLYKSLLTSHFGTTGLNLKGWAGTVAPNTVSDFIQGSLEIAGGTLARPFTGADAYEQALMRGRGSITGAMRRGVHFLQPEDTIEKALAYMTYRPEILTKLSKDLGGDSGARAGAETLEIFGIKDNLATRSAESVRSALQSATGVKLQDELTKMLSWQSNIDLMIRRVYGKGYNEFMEDPTLGFIEMNSPKYRNKVEASALDRTLRETYSLEWSTKKGSGLALQAARLIEKSSSNAVGGYLIPFGKFFNTSIAMMSDYTPINASRALWRSTRGQQSELASEELSQLIAKSAVGATLAYSYSNVKLENLKEGLRWNQVREDDGSISDKTYDFPQSILHIVGQMIAHNRQDGEIPPDLAAELADIVVGSTFRGSADAVETVYDMGIALSTGDVKSVGYQATEVLLGTVGRISSGFTRSLEPLNVGLKAIKGDFQEPDRNIDGDGWTEWSVTKKATRYIDEFFEVLGAGADDSPRAASPVKPEGQVPDTGKVLLGVRGTSGNSLSETMLASVGRPSWKAFRWGNDADVKNYMNSRVSLIFDEQTARMFESNPNFFNLPLATREVRTEQVIKRTKELTIEYMEAHGGDMSHRSRLAAVSERDLGRAMEHLGVEGDPKDLLKENNGAERLGILLEWAENFDEYAIRDSNY